MYEEKLKNIQSEIRDEYLKNNIPWVITYSGGKDSSTVAQIVLDTISNLDKREKEVHIVYIDSKVDPPPITENVKTIFGKINEWVTKNNLPVKTEIIFPELGDNFFVLMLGKGYTPPATRVRWCTERMKVRPMKKYISGLVEKHGGCIVLLGLRLKESTAREKRLEKKGGGKWMPFTGVKEALSYSPIIDMTDDDVWNYLLNNKTPWGTDNEYLKYLYIGGNPAGTYLGTRFGCWICTVVSRDRSTEGLSKLPEWEWIKELVEYRNLMFRIRKDLNYRIFKMRSGKLCPGSLTLEARKLLYEELKKVESKIQRTILSPEEEELIFNYWKEVE